MTVPTQPIQVQTQPRRGRLRLVPRRPRLRVEHVTVVEKQPMKRAIVGALVGNFMEWYDFGIYGYLTAIMAVLFVPNVPEQWRMVVVLAGFAVSFLVRPIGGFVFGPLGDRIGRQKVLALTMLMMSGATAGIGLLPTSHTIGNWAFLGLILLRMVQGFSTGGEYAGATTFVAEYAPDRRRGFLASILDVGSYLGFAAGAGVVVLTQLAVGEQGMLDFWWRLPFLIALPLGLISLWFRTKIEETPAFESTQAAQEAFAEGAGETVEKTTIGQIIRTNWREILIAMALVAATNTAGYSLTSYMPSYLETNHGYTALGAALATIPALVILSILVPFVGRLSDRIGRKPVYGIAIVSSLVLTIPAYMMMANRNLVFLSMLMLAFSVLFYIAISASSLPALFSTTTRYGALAIAYNLSASLFGGTAPMISELLVKVTGLAIAPAFYTMFFSAVAGVAALLMVETARKPLPGSMPTVGSVEEAHELVATQHENPDLVVEELPIAEHDALQAARAEAAAPDEAADPAPEGATAADTHSAATR